MEGISFLVRVHNEEETLAQSLQSLLSFLTIGFEILVLLNACTDSSAAIAAMFAARDARVRVFEYNYTLSRPGYEMLATDFTSVHNGVTFLNWGMKKARYRWTWKWDADFRMTQELAARVHEKGVGGGWGAQVQGIVRLGARGRDGGIEMGDYLSSCIDHYRKDVFWETPAFRFEAGKLVREEWADVWIEHMTRVGRLKPYWVEAGWYTRKGLEGREAQEAALVRGRLLALERDFGMQPAGLGRSGTTDRAVALAMEIVRVRPAYVELWGGE